MTYKIVIKHRAKKFISSLNPDDRRRIVQAIETLPNTSGIKKMQGHDNLYRLRVGDYRIIYSIDNGAYIIMIIDAGNRGDIYKKY